LAEEIDFEIDHFCTFQISVTLTLDQVTCVSLIDLYLHSKFCSNRKNVLWTDRRTDIETGFIRSTKKRHLLLIAQRQQLAQH